MDCTTIGASPPITTFPTLTGMLFRLAIEGEWFAIVLNLLLGRLTESSQSKNL
jgi:hypothetical protein